MPIFPEHRLSIKEAWITSFQLYRKSFPKVWYFALAAGCLGDIFHLSFDLGVLVSYLILAPLNMYPASLILYQTHNIGMEKNLTFKDLISITKKKYIKLIIIFFVILTPIDICLVVFGPYLGVIIFMLGNYVNCSYELITMGIFCLPFLMTLLLLYISECLILFDSQKIWDSIEITCILLLGNIWRSLIIILPSVAAIVIMSELPSKHIWWYQAAALLIMKTLLYPAFFASVLILFNDLKLRKTIATAEGRPEHVDKVRAHDIPE
jgi:hypothetical protein